MVILKGFYGCVLKTGLRFLVSGRRFSLYQLLYPIRDEVCCAIFPFDPVNNGNRGSLSAFLKWIWM